MRHYGTVATSLGISVVTTDKPWEGGNGVGSLALAYALAKKRAGWSEGGTGLQQVDADTEVAILHAFRGLPSRPAPQ